MKKTGIFSAWYFVLVPLVIFGLSANAASQPVNDNFAATTVISGETGAASATNVDATAEAGEPYHGATNTPARSIWFSWTAPVSGLIVFDTAGSSYDTALAAYTGTDVASLSQLDANNNALGLGTRSQITFYAHAGTTYAIAVDGSNGAQGTVTLNWDGPPPPANDDFASAVGQTAFTGSTLATNKLASAETGEPSHGASGTPAASVWYAWTPPVSCTIVFDTLGSDFDTTLAAYTGTAVDSLTQVAANDDIDATNSQSRISFPAAGGTTYYIAVDGFEGAEGNIILNRQPLPPANDNFAAATSVSGNTGTTSGHTVNATAETGEQFHGTYYSPDRSVWYKWIAPSTAPVSFESVTTSFNSALAVYTGTSLYNLTQVTASYMDPWNPSNQENSRVVFTPISGTTYYIAVDGFNHSTGSFTLNWGAAPLFATVSGTVSLPAGDVAPAGGVNVYLAFYDGTSPIFYLLQIPEGMAAVQYAVHLPVIATTRTLSYNLFYPLPPGYFDAGYYASTGTTEIPGDAEPLSGNADLSGIDLELIPLPVFTVTPEAGANGSISPDTPQTVSQGDTTSFTITPASGYFIESVTGCGGGLSGNTYSTAPVTADCTVTATFTDIPTLHYPPIAATNNTYEWITNVTLGSINNSSGRNPNGYGDYTAMSTPVAAEGTYPLAVTIDADYADYITAFIDWNRNGVFTDPGEALPVVTDTSSNGPHTVDITVPAGAVLGTTRMRIVLNWDGPPPSSGTFAYGEAEDYTLDVVSGVVTVTPSPGAHGTMSPSTPQVIPVGETSSFTINPEANYHIASVTGCGGSLVGDTYTTGPVASDCTVSASFALDTHTVTPSAGANGSLSPSAPQAVGHGQTASFIITPAPGYFIGSVSGCGGTLNGRTFLTGPVTADCTVSATFTDYADITANNVFEYITNVTLGSINNTTGPDPGGYGNYTGQSTTVSAGSSQSISVSIRPAGPEYITAFVDWNQNGVFSDPGETIVVASNVSVAGPFTVPVSVPATAIPGPTLMRVVLKWAISPPSSGNIGDGEVEDYTVVVTRTNTVTPSPGSGGTMSPASPQSIEHGANTSLTVTPQTGYHLVSVTSDTCGGTLLDNTFTTGAVTSDCTVSATFALDTFTVTPSAGANGSISPATPQTVNYNATTAFTVTPGYGYHGSVTGCGGTLVGSIYTTGPVTADCSVAATFVKNTYTVTPESGSGGSMTPASPQSIDYLGQTSFTITPDSGYVLDTVLGCEGTLSGNTYTTAAVRSNCTVVALFTGSAYKITPIAGEHGSITPDSPQQVAYGGASLFTLTPEAGFKIKSVSGCPGTLAGENYTAGPITENCAVVVEFAKKFPWPMFLPAINGGPLP